MKRRMIAIEVTEDGVFTQVPAREFTEEEEADIGLWEPWVDHDSLDEALDHARESLTEKP